MSEPIDFIVHGPPGSAPPVLAAAFLAGIEDMGLVDTDVRLVPRGDDPGVDAMHALVARPGDGRVISTCTPVFIQAPLLRGMTLTHRALTPIARLVTDQFFLIVRADAPWTTAADFLKDIGKRRTRTGGYFKGGINHLLALAIAEGAGAEVDFVVTPSEPAVWTALIDGSIDWGCGVAAEIWPHLESGAVRVLATLDDARGAPFLDVPTLGEAGVPVTFKLWRGLMGPPDLTIAQQVWWHQVAETVTRTVAWRQYLTRNGQSDGFLPGEPFQVFLESEWDWYEKHLRLAGLIAP